MDEDMEKCEEDLKDLCNDMIYLLNELKDKGLMQNDEYERHIYLKQEFLNNIY